MAYEKQFWEEGHDECRECESLEKANTKLRAELATLTQQFTDYRAQAEKKIAELQKEIDTFGKLVDYDTKAILEHADTIKQSGERIERLEAALKAIKGLGGHSNSYIIAREAFKIVESALGGTEQ